MPFPHLALFIRKKPTLYPQRRRAAFKQSFRWWPAHTHTSFTGSGGGVGGGTADPPLVVLHEIATGGGYGSGTSRAIIALHLSGSGGGVGSGTATVTSRLQGTSFHYPDITSEVPEINADEISSTLPQERD